MTICAISSDKAAFPTIHNSPFININCLTFLTHFITAFDNGANAFILDITPPNAPTHIIITITQEPAPSNPTYIKFKKELKDSTVPAKLPNINDETIPTAKHNNVGNPFIATNKTSANGIAI